MSAEQPECLATTKAGIRCKNHAKVGSVYCGVHAPLFEAAENDTSDTVDASEPAVATKMPPDAPPAAASAAEPGEQTALSVLLTALNQLAQEMHQRYPDFVPPAYSTQDLRDLVYHNFERFTPDIQNELLSDLKTNIEGTSPKDLMDPDVWKGLWYILNYAAQAQAESAIKYLAERLASLPGMNYVANLPGMDVVSELAANLEGASPKDFVDPDTWKGMYMLVNYTVQGTASDLKRKLLGDEDDE